MPSPWTNVPVVTTIGSGFGGLPQSTGANDIQSYDFWNQFYRAIQEKLLPFGCDNKYPPGNLIWGTATVDGVTDNNDSGPHTLILHFSGVDWPLPAGSTGSGRWHGFNFFDPDLCGIPNNYDLVIEGDPADAYSVIRLKILGNTYDSATHTGTMTVDADYLFNAVVAGFISPSATTWIMSKLVNILKRDTGLWSTDRRPLKPNQREAWRGTIFTGFWDETNHRGMIQQKINDYNPDPYNKPNPITNWKLDKWKAKEILFFDGSNKLYRKTILGNDKNRIVIGAAVFKLTTGGSSGTFKLGITVQGTILETPALAFNASGSAIATAINALFPGAVTVSGSNPYDIVFNTASGAALIKLTDNTTGFTILVEDPSVGPLGGGFIVVYVNDKGMPNRIPDPMFVWSRGLTQEFISHDPTDTLRGAKKIQPIGRWQDVNNDLECILFSHDCFDIDCQIEYFNICECGRDGDFLEPNFYKSWRQLQVTLLGLMQNYLDLFNLTGDGEAFRFFTPATWALGYQTDSTINTTGANLHAWSTGMSVDATTHVVTIASTGAMPYYPIGVYYTFLDDHEGNAGSGQATLNADGTLSVTADPSLDGNTVVLWPGFSRFRRRRFKDLYPSTRWIGDCELLLGCIDPPTITPGGHIDSPTGITLTPLPTAGTLTYSTTYSYRISALNGSGETIPTTASTIKASVCSKVCTTPPCPPNALVQVCQTSNTYRIRLDWNHVTGASNYNIYGRVGGSEALLGSVSEPTTSFTDDGSVTPGVTPPTTNTTHNDCYGVGIWVYRDPSVNYSGRSFTGFLSEGGAADPPFIENDIAVYMGDAFQDPFDGRGGVRTSLEPDAYFWDHFFQGRRAKPYDLVRKASKKGVISSGTKFSFHDSDKNWFDDTVNNGFIRYQGGILTGGGATSAEDSGWNTGNKACWWNPTRFIGSGGQWWKFILQICKGGLPVGWVVAADGTATYAEPDITHSGTLIPLTAPTIASVRPSVPVGDGHTHIFVIVGNNFDPACTITITDVTNSVTYAGVGTRTIAPGVVVLDFAFPTGGNWSVKATNPTNLDSNVQTFTVQVCHRVPITAGASGILSYTGVSGISSASGDGYLIAEPAGYELNKWERRRVVVSKSDGTQIKLRILNSDKNDVYVATQSTEFLPGWSYEIIEHETASKFKFKTTVPTDGRDYVEIAVNKYWVDPAGDADTRSGTNVPCHKNLNENLETKVVDYGLYMSMDDFGAHIPNELYYIIQSLRWTNGNADCYIPEGELNFTADQVLFYEGRFDDYGPFKGAGYGPGTAVFGTGGPNPPYAPGLPPTGRNYSDSWGGSTGYYNSRGGAGNIRELHESSSPGCPYSFINVRVSSDLGSGVPHWMGISMVDTIEDSGQYSYMKDSLIPTCLACEIDIYGLGWVDGANTPEGLISDWPARDEVKFNPQGTGLIYHKWAIVDTLPLGTSDTRLGTNKIGLDPVSVPSIDQPPDPLPHQPDDGTVNAADAGSNYEEGFYFGDKKAVRRWDVPGGMIWL